MRPRSRTLGAPNILPNPARAFRVGSPQVGPLLHRTAHPVHSRGSDRGGRHERPADLCGHLGSHPHQKRCGPCSASSAAPFGDATGRECLRPPNRWKLDSLSRQWGGSM